MKPYVILASDDNPLYLDFWPITAKIWKHLGYEPILCYFGNKPTNELAYSENIMRYKKPINPEGINLLPIATCWSRYWQAAQMNYWSLISDIDMIPLSWIYWKDALEYTNGIIDYIHLNNCIETYGRLPSCYHFGHPFYFDELFINGKTFTESLNHLISQNFDNSACFIPGSGNDYWCYDEFYTTEILKKHGFLSYYRPGGQSGRRIDRTYWVYDESLLKGGYYFDAHCPRPLNDNLEEIKKIVKLAIDLDI